jgi:hypothetical protein
MPGKGKEKAAVKAKQGAQLKDILPPTAKQPREGEGFDVIEEPEEEAPPPERDYEYLPYTDFPVWPGNEEVQEMCEKEKEEFEEAKRLAEEAKAAEEAQKEEGKEEGKEDSKGLGNELKEDDSAAEDSDASVVSDGKPRKPKLFKDRHKFYLPPSYSEFCTRKNISWIRPKYYLYDIAYVDQEK